MVDLFKPTSRSKGSRGMFFKAPDEMYERIGSLALTHNTTRSEIIRQAVKYALDRMESGEAR